MMSGPRFGGGTRGRAFGRCTSVAVLRGRVGADERHLTGDGCHGGLMTSAAAAKVVR